MTTITDAGAHSSVEATDKFPAMKGSTKGYSTPLQFLAYLSGSGTFQPLDSDLTAIAALSTTSYGRALLALADLAALRTVLGPSGTPSASTYLRGDGSWATPAGGGGGGGDLLSTNNLSDLANAATALTNLGLSANASSLVTAANYAAMRALLDLEAGTDFYSKSAADAAFQPLASALTSLASASANGVSLVTAANYAAMRALLDLEAGTDFYSVSAANAAFQPLDSDLTAIAALTTTSFGRGLLALADAAALRTSAGVVIGTDVQAYSAQLAAIVGLSPSNDDIIQRKAGAWTNRTVAQVLTDLATAGAKTVGKETIWIPAVAMIARTTNGAAAGSAETSSNKNMFKTLDFDTTTQEFAQFRIHLPKSWNLGTVTFQPVWSHASTTTNFGVVWGLQAVAHSDDDAGDAAFGTEQTSTDTGGTTDDIYIGPESSAITIAGTPAAGDIVQFQLKRNVSDGSDTMAIDARLHGIRLFFTTNASTDA